MLRETILNQVERNQSFVYGARKFISESASRAQTEVPISARSNGRSICSNYRPPGAGYDRLADCQGGS